MTLVAGLLFRMAAASVEQPDGRLRDVVFSRGRRQQTLRDVAPEYKASGAGYRFQAQVTACRDERTSWAAGQRRSMAMSSPSARLAGMAVT
ncbi:MAG: hypothetical protein JO023_29305 [Chloroflexi bacterium]|nr:hypothetical protein [Chloroflexota bacterium]